MPDQPALRPGVFLDRDGTIAEELGYLNHASGFRIFHFAADLRRSFVAGDRYGDFELAQNVCACSILVRTGYREGELAWNAANWPAQPDFIADDLSHAADWILRQQK